MGVNKNIFFILLAIFLSVSVMGTLYSPIQQRYIRTNQNSDYYYIQIHKADNTNTYLGINKNTRGSIGISDDAGLYGNMLLVPAFKHPVNSQWYLCPIRNIATVSSVQDLGNGWQISATDPAIACYQYANPLNTGTANISLRFSLVTDSNARTKINVNVSIFGISPADTGFGFMFFPTDPSKYRYVNLSGTIYDLAGVEGNVSVDKVIEFLNSNQNPIGQVFDWSDMLDNGNRFSRIMTVNSQKALLIGTYGYGASNTISIDPLFSVDYSPIPAMRLFYGLVDTINDDAFANQIDITTGVSDNSTATNYELRKRSNFLAGGTIIAGYNQDETTGTIMYDQYVNGLNGTFVNSPDLTIAGLTNTGTKFNGVNQYAVVNTSTAFDISATEDIGICFGVNTNLSIGNNNRLIQKMDAGGGWEIYGSPSSTITLSTDRSGSNSKSVATATSFTTSAWRTVCFFGGLNNMTAYVDGVLDKTTVVAQSGTIATTVNMFLGSSGGISLFSDDALDEICIMKGVNLNAQAIAQAYQTKLSCGGDVNRGIGITGKWSEVYDPLYNWYVVVYKTTAGTQTLNIEAYNTSNTLAGQRVTKSLVGTGFFNINVSSLMNYEKNIRNLTFTQFRLYFDAFSTVSTNISELVLRQEVNDTIPPNISNCKIRDNTFTERSNFGCLETLEFECEMSDNVDIDTAYAKINGVKYLLNQDPSPILHYDTYISPTSNGTIVYTWQQANATDISGLTTTIAPNNTATYTCIFEQYINIQHNPTLGHGILNLTNTSVTIYWTTANLSNSRVDYGLTPTNLSLSAIDNANVLSHYVPLSSLIPNTTYYYNITSSFNPTQTKGTFNFTTITSCVENWVQDPFTCQINDSYFSTYTDTHSCGTVNSLPPTNGTVQFCNYCSENLVQTLGDCEQDSTQTVDYQDSNYFTCCAVTGLPSDCDILVYPYNATTTQFCVFFNNTMGEMECDPNPFFNGNEKEYCLARIPNIYLNQTFKCISYIEELDTDKVVQTNPEYRERSNSFIDLFRPDPETRQFFEPANSLVNFYYTSKNLFPETDYKLFIECSSAETTLSSGQLFQMHYENYEFVFFRTKWIMENAGYIIGGVIVLFIILAVGWLIFKGVG